MSEEKLFDVNWDQRKWETPASAQDMKLYSYPPRTIRNMSVPGFLTWLVLLLASIGGLLYTAWMTVTGDYEERCSCAKTASQSAKIDMKCVQVL